MVSAWFLMDRRIDWQAIPTVFELVGWRDVELGIAVLDAIRDEARSMSEE